jgi:hypothetical protein
MVYDISTTSVAESEDHVSALARGMLLWMIPEASVGVVSFYLSIGGTALQVGDPRRVYLV